MTRKGIGLKDLPFYSSLFRVNMRRLVTLPNKIKLISIILRDVSITKVIAPALALVW